ncbi:MAG: zinc ribbon domain-containing protein [Planctomycetota bacterium]
MPIYEFYCPDCHKIFSFMSRKMNTRKKPACPKCGKPKIARRVSLFSVSKKLSEADAAMPFPDMDESCMEKAMETLAREADKIDEDNPRQVAEIMRTLYKSTGLKLGPGMEEAMQRMESGEDPEKIEADLGEVLESEDPFSEQGSRISLKGLRRRIMPPSRDETLYDL